jgi:hypothetical protein
METAPLLSTQALSSVLAGRTLALVIECPALETIPGKTQILSEILLRFSPRIVTRSGSVGSASGSALWFFLDVSSNASWIERTFGNEVRLVEAVLKTLGSLDHHARVAIADTPQAAQAFAVQHGFWISAPGSTRRDLDRLPLSSLLHLEGVNAWTHSSRVDAIANFFALLGFTTLGHLASFTEASFHERWGELGAKVYRRLQGAASLDPQPIAPFLPTDPLKAFVHLDYPVTIVSLLLHEVENAMKTLFARLEGRRLIVRRLRVCLRCEYSNHEHVFTIEPSAPTRELRFFRLLLENRLDRIELLNPIQDLEIEIDPLPENERQDGFHDRAAADQTKLALLTSLLAQEGATAGFASIEDDVWPENTWVMNPDSTKLKPSHRLVELAQGGELNESERPSRCELAQGELDETGFAPKFHYALALEKAPRPALLLRKPRVMESQELSQLQFYSGRPIERIEHSWWEGRAGPPGTPSLGERRDYYIACDRHGRNLWLYQDQKSEQFFLHGAFD